MYIIQCQEIDKTARGLNLSRRSRWIRLHERFRDKRRKKKSVNVFQHHHFEPVHLSDILGQASFMR